MKKSIQAIEVKENMSNLKTLKRCPKYWLTKDETHNRLEVYNARLANKLNQLLLTYDKGRYIFRSDDEAVFRLTDSQMRDVLNNVLLKKVA